MKSSELFDVTGLVTIVTGGAKGLGRAIGEALAENGAKVVLFDFNRATLDATVADLTGRGWKVEGSVVDVTDRAGLRAAVDAVVAKHGRLDVCFANAGIDAGPGFLGLDGKRIEAGAMENIPDELWDRVIATNLTSAFDTVRAAARHMKPQGSGRIILTSSIAGLRPATIVGTPYPVTKAAIAHMTKQAAAELVRYNVLVNAILPGPFLTDLTTPELKKAFEAGMPGHRCADPWELQGLALFLSSKASTFITGTQMVIDGGSTLGRVD